VSSKPYAGKNHIIVINVIIVISGYGIPADAPGGGGKTPVPADRPPRRRSFASGLPPPGGRIDVSGLEQA
jgi:hypothetical protein